MQLFRLDEYGSATTSFLSDAIHALAQSRHEILSKIPVEHVESLPLAVDTLPSTPCRRDTCSKVNLPSSSH